MTPHLYVEPLDGKVNRAVASRLTGMHRLPHLFYTELHNLLCEKILLRCVAGTTEVPHVRVCAVRPAMCEGDVIGPSEISTLRLQGRSRCIHDQRAAVVSSMDLKDIVEVRFIDNRMILNLI